MGLPVWHETGEAQNDEIEATTEKTDLELMGKDDLILSLTSHAVLLGAERHGKYRVQITLPDDPDNWSIVLTEMTCKPDRIIEFCGLPRNCSTDTSKILVTSRVYTPWASDERFDQTMFDMLPVTPIDAGSFFENISCDEDNDYKHTIQMHFDDINAFELPTEWSEALQFVLKKQTELSATDDDFYTFQVDLTYVDCDLEDMTIQCRRGLDDCMFRIFSIRDEEECEIVGWLQDSFDDDDLDDADPLTLEEAWDAMMQVE